MNGATGIDQAHRGLLNMLPASQQATAPCDSCELTGLCLPALLADYSDAIRNRILNALIRQQVHHVLGDRYLFRQDDPFDTLFIVQTGAVKTVLLDASGCEQISGFYYPGNLFGLDGISTSRYATSAVALGNTQVCALEFSRLESITTQIPDLQHHLFTLMAREIESNQRMMSLLSRKSAEQKVAYFLLRMGAHLQRSGQSGGTYTLPMTRRDIGNHLGLAVETVSRIFTKFQRLGLCVITGRRLQRLDMEGLQRQLHKAARPQTDSSSHSARS